MNWPRWLTHAETFLGTVKLWDFTRCSGATLWDVLWEDNNQRNGCSGYISDFIERDIEYRVKETGPKGEYREPYDEYLEREELEDTEERREQYARDDVYDMVGSYYKRKNPKSTRSKYNQPCYFDFIEDIDDDIEVALAFGVVELSKSELSRLNRIYKKTPKLYEKWRRVMCARKLVREVAAVSDVRYGDPIEIGNVIGLCNKCFRSLVEEDKVASRRPDSLGELACNDCGVLVTPRSAKATLRYVLDGRVAGVDYYQFVERPILALDERLPGESETFLTPSHWVAGHLVTCFNFSSLRQLWRWVSDLSSLSGSPFASTAWEELDESRCRYVDYTLRYEHTIGFHADGRVTLSDGEDSGVYHPVTEDELEACRDALLQAGAPEARDYAH